MADAVVVTEEKKEDAVESPTKTSSKGSLDMDAFHNFLQGKRHILVHDYLHAVGSLSKACEMYVEHYGQTAIECGDVYFFYGKALFRLFQQNAGIIGDVLPDGSNDEEEEDEENETEDSEEDKEKENTGSTSNENDDDEEEEQQQQQEEADEEDLVDEDSKGSESETVSKEGSPSHPEKIETTDSAKDSVDKSETQNQPVVDGHDKENQQSEGSSEQHMSEPGPSGSQPKQKSEDEITDLQIAWETLETAKSIFRRQGDNNNAELKVAEILLILGEISLEQERYASAYADLNECLKIREHLLKPDDRLIAETYYQLALGYTYDSQVELAMENYEKSINVIELRISNLKKQTVIEQTPDGFDIDPAVEIAELETILPDIRAKMEDTQGMMPDARKVVKEMALQKMDKAAGGNSSSDKPATNIGHLLKRKKPEDSDGAKQIEVKKIKLSVPESGENQVNSETTAPASSPSTT